MMAFGGWGTSLTTSFNVPATYSKQARFRTSWTGGVPGYLGVPSFQLNGATVLTPNGQELGQAWSQWSPVVSGSTNVTWSTTCGYYCGSAVDLFEWKAWETGSAQFHTKLRFPGQYHDVETALYENWNRYYDHHTGRYLSPEPLLQNPKRSVSVARFGRANTSYAYGLGNPVAYSDVDGLDVTNNTSGTVWVKPENDTTPVKLPPSKTFKGPQDGFTHPDRPGKVFKTTDNNDAVCSSGGGVETEPSPDLGPVDRLRASASQAAGGGWKDSSFKNKHSDWKALFEKGESARKRAAPTPPSGTGP